MLLLDLPLVLVQDIIYHVVRSYTHADGKQNLPITHLLELREVNRFFDNELMRQLGRQFKRWPEEDRQRCMWNASVAFTIQTLSAFIGDNDRRHSSLIVTRMHASIDIFEEQARNIGKLKIRHEILHHLCYALAIRLHTRTEFVDREAHEAEHMAIAIVIAIASKNTDIMNTMLNTCAVRPDQRTWDFGHFIDLAITLGLTDSVRVLINNGATIDNDPWSQTSRALRYAAQVGNLEVLELVLASMPIDQDHETFSTYGKVIQRAASYQQWDVVHRLLDKYMYDIEEEQLKSIICWGSQTWSRFYHLPYPGCRTMHRPSHVFCWQELSLVRRS